MTLTTQRQTCSVPFAHHSGGTIGPCRLCGWPRGRWTAQAPHGPGTDNIVGAPYLSAPIGRYVTRLLGNLGYDATLHLTNPSSYFAAIEGQSRKAQIGVESWTADYVTGSGFIAPLVACHSASNWTGVCDRTIDRRMEQATQLRSTDPARANDEWSKIDHDLVDKALFVPFGTRYWVQLVSGRLGNYRIAPQWGPLVDQMWVQ